MLLTLAPVSYTAVVPMLTILTRKLAFPQSLILICILVQGLDIGMDQLVMPLNGAEVIHHHLHPMLRNHER